MTSEPVAGDANTGERQDEPPALPVGGLLALALAGFITILTETLPAGLLSQIEHAVLKVCRM
jgi:hypothetical protein